MHVALTFITIHISRISFSLSLSLFSSSDHFLLKYRGSLMLVEFLHLTNVPTRYDFNTIRYLVLAVHCLGYSRILCPSIG